MVIAFSKVLETKVMEFLLAITMSTKSELF